MMHTQNTCNKFILHLSGRKMKKSVDVRTSIALANHAVIVSEISGLSSEKGIPLNLSHGDNFLIRLLPAPCCAHHASAGTKPLSSAGGPVSFFDTAEHDIIVSKLYFHLADGRVVSATEEPLALAPTNASPNAQFQLTYGQILALGGDFFGDPNQPVCTAQDPIAQFAKNFDTLAENKSEVAAILAVAITYEFEPLATAVYEKREPSGVYANLPTSIFHFVSDEDRAYDEATGGTALKNGRYLNLAFRNFDHFGVDAITCYKAGHTLAQQTAAAAARISDARERDYQLRRAYAINAFADHFLSDLFAAGHMRTPRRALFNSALNYVTRVAAGACAKQMHDEDNKFGLWVENAVGDKWVAYGDGRYRDTVNSASRVVLKKAVQQSMDDVWAAFENPQKAIDPDAKSVLQYIASVITEITKPTTGPTERDNPMNWSPLFWNDPATSNVWRRNGLFDPSDRTFSEQRILNGWGLSTTVAQLVTAHFPVYMSKQEYTNANLPFPPYEKGPKGEYGWPAGPIGVEPAWKRPMVGYTGPDLLGGPGATSWDWGIAGARGTTHIPGATFAPDRARVTAAASGPTGATGSA